MLDERLQTKRLQTRDAFENMPGSRTPLPGLLFLLGLVFAYNAYVDLTRAPDADAADETVEELAARRLKVLEDEISQVLPDGRVLLKDGVPKPTSSKNFLRLHARIVSSSFRLMRVCHRASDRSRLQYRSRRSYVLVDSVFCASSAYGHERLPRSRRLVGC